MFSLVARFTWRILYYSVVNNNWYNKLHTTKPFCTTCTFSQEDLYYLFIKNK